MFYFYLLPLNIVQIQTTELENSDAKYLGSTEALMVTHKAVLAALLNKHGLPDQGYSLHYPELSDGPDPHPEEVAPEPDQSAGSTPGSDRHQ
jgi:hypothetical protein